MEIERKWVLEPPLTGWASTVAAVRTGVPGDRPGGRRGACTAQGREDAVMTVKTGRVWCAAKRSLEIANFDALWPLTAGARCARRATSSRSVT